MEGSTKAMLKVILVDDELCIRQGLGKLIDWEALGYEIIGDFENGYEALSFIKDNPVDLIILDINMPLMDGLTLMDKLREFRKCEIIILSGYGEFNYAKKFMQHGVRYYLLKPVDESELVDALNELRASIHMQEQNAVMEKSRRLFLERKLLEEMLLFDLSEQDGKTLYENLQLNEPSRIYRIVLVKLFGAKTLHIDTINAFLDERSSQNHIHKAIYNQGIIHIFCDYNIVETGYEDEIAPALCDFLKSLELRFVVSSGKIVRDIREIKLSKDSAKHGIELSFYIGIDRCVDAEYISSRYGEQSSILTWNDAGLLNAIKAHEPEQVKQELEILFAEFSKRLTPRSLVMSVITNIVYSVNDLLIDCSSSLNEMYAKKINLEESLLEIHTLDGLRDWFWAFCQDIAEHISFLYKEKNYVFIRRAKEIIDDQFTGDIHLKDIASRLYISPDYLGRQLKDILGLSFNEYVTDKRIMYAKELLRTTGLNVYEVAYKSGFQSVNYFAKQFKKIVGKTPNDIRKGEYKKKL